MKQGASRAAEIRTAPATRKTQSRQGQKHHAAARARFVRVVLRLPFRAPGAGARVDQQQAGNHEHHQARKARRTGKIVPVEPEIADHCREAGNTEIFHRADVIQRFQQRKHATGEDRRLCDGQAHAEKQARAIGTQQPRGFDHIAPGTQIENATWNVDVRQQHEAENHDRAGRLRRSGSQGPPPGFGPRIARMPL